MALNYKGSGSGAGTSIAIPAHAIGDLILIWAYRDGATAIPTKPAAAGTVPAWVTIDGPVGANLNSAILCSFVATATNHTSGTWTNATGMSVLVLGNQAATAIGDHGQTGNAVGTGGNLVTQAFGVVQAPVLDGTSGLIHFFGWRTVTAWSAAPAGYTTRSSVATETEVLSKDVTTSDGALTVSGTASGNGGYRAQIVEVLAASSAIVVTLGQVTETETAQALTERKRLALGQVLETETTRPLAAVKRSALGQVLEIDAARALAVADRVVLGQAGELETARGLTLRKRSVVGQSLDTSTAQSLTSRKAVPLGRVDEVEFARAISATVAGAIVAVLTPAVETDSGRSVTVVKKASLGLVQELDVAQALFVTSGPQPHVIVLNQVLEVDEAQALVVRYNKPPPSPLEILGNWAPLVPTRRERLRMRPGLRPE